MEIQSFPIKYVNTPDLRSFPIQIESVVIASENLPTLDLEDLMKKHISMNGQTIEYNYAVMKDGEVYALRPEIYESSTSVLPNVLSIVLEGDFHHESITTAQQTALEQLSIYAMEKFSIPWNGVLSVDDIVGGSKMGELFSTTQLKKAVAEVFRDPVSEALGIKEIGSYQTTADELYGVLRTTSAMPTINEVISTTGNDAASLHAMNATLESYQTYIPVGTPILYTKTIASYENIEKIMPEIIMEAAVQSTSSMINSVIEIMAPEIVTYDFQKEISASRPLVDYNRYGGRPEPSFYKTGLMLPGYETASIKIYNRQNNEAKILYFQVSPGRITDSRRPNMQVIRSQSGFFVWRNGEHPAEITFSGYMLDSKEVSERHSFLVAYKRYVEDKHTEYMEYFNEFTIKLCIEGIEYSGLISSISFSKDASKPYLYEYTIQFLSFSQRNVYMNESTTGLTWAVAPEDVTLMQAVGDSFSEEQAKAVAASVAAQKVALNLSMGVMSLLGLMPSAALGVPAASSTSTSNPSVFTGLGTGSQLAGVGSAITTPPTTGNVTYTPGNGRPSI